MCCTTLRSRTVDKEAVFFCCSNRFKSTAVGQRNLSEGLCEGLIGSSSGGLTSPPDPRDRPGSLPAVWSPLTWTFPLRMLRICVCVVPLAVLAMPCRLPAFRQIRGCSLCRSHCLLASAPCVDRHSHYQNLRSRSTSALGRVSRYLELCRNVKRCSVQMIE